MEILLAERTDRRAQEKVDYQETCTITINLLVLLGIVVTAWVMLEPVGDRPDAEGDSILM